MESPLDALVVGAGFAGIHLLHSLRSEGFSVKGVEAGGDIGGVWYWNNYPGARVDSDFFIYQYSKYDLFKTFDYTERFPSRDEVFGYFQHVDKKLDVKKDIHLNTSVTEADFNNKTDLWTVKSSTGITWTCRFLFLCTGASFKPYTPDIKGLQNFKGEMHHTSLWPKDRKVEFEGKRVGVIGTGPSGVQVIQETGPFASHLTIFQRTPGSAMPMGQRKLPNSKCPGKDRMPELFTISRTTFTGLPMDHIKQNGSEVSAAERRALNEKLWDAGGFDLFFANYQDILTSKEVNEELYDFWVEKTRPRISNEKKRNILLPLKPPHPFGAKPPCLEQNFYEICDQDNVEIVDMVSTPIEEITTEGLLKTSDGVTREIDLLVFATGFDSLNGSASNIKLRNSEGTVLGDQWKEKGTSTLFGLAVAGFPNMFFVYGPQGPTGFANGPTCAEVQGEWLTRLLVKMRNEGKTRCVPEKGAEDEWVEKMTDTWNKTLLLDAKSWVTGANIPGKRREVLTYAGGFPEYHRFIRECEEKQYEGFQIV